MIPVQCVRAARQARLSAEPRVLAGMSYIVLTETHQPLHMRMLQELSQS